MTLEQIIALLTAKFAGVRKDGLTQIARNMMLLATTETEVQALIDRLTAEKVTEIVNDYRKDVDKEVTNSTRTHETNLRKKYDFKEKADPADPGKTSDPVDPSNIAAVIAAEVAKVMKPLQDELAGFKGGQVKQTRLQQLETKLKDAPAAYKADKLKDFNRMQFDTDDAFTEYLTETESGVTALTQEIADKGLGQQGKPVFGKPNKEGVSSAVSQFIESKAKPETGLGGKEV